MNIIMVIIVAYYCYKTIKSGYCLAKRKEELRVTVAGKRER